MVRLPWFIYWLVSYTHLDVYKRQGKYYLKAGNATSPLIIIGNDVYKGSADFALRYMRQQRSGFNPFLKDSCHNQDGYSLYGSAAGLPDSTFVDVSGGWHDASDYLQYSCLLYTSRCV